MKTYAWLSALFIVLIIVVMIDPIQAQDTAYPPPDQSIIEDLFTRLNALRTRRGLHTYQLNPVLNAAAQDQAEWLVHTGIRGHRRPDGSTPSHRAAAAGYQHQGWCCGENYYMSIDATPDMVWNFWVNSRSHYANLMHRDFEDVGIGMTTDGYRISYVMVFATPFDPTEVLVEAPAAVPVANPATVEVTADSAAESGGGFHIVQRGETLFRIGVGYGVSVDRLASANGITNPAMIYPGQRLVIPGAGVESNSAPPAVQVAAAPELPAAQPVSSEGTHLVQSGENLFRLAQRYGVSLEALAAANDITDPRRLRAGQVLVIPQMTGE